MLRILLSHALNAFLRLYSTSCFYQAAYMLTKTALASDGSDLRKSSDHGVERRWKVDEYEQVIISPYLFQET